MKNLVVLAHPIEDSFNAALAKSIVEALEAKGEEVIFKDLYKMNFNPTLTAQEMAEVREGALRDDIKIEQELIKECDNFIFIYPLWWASLPAILKGYIDRVFSYGFAYAYNEQGEVDGLLKGKSIVNITTQGTPNEYYEASGMFDALNKTIDSGIFEFCGMSVKEHIFLGGIPYINKEEGEKIIDDVISKL
jgi:NAD(P)H dehydrogenase (quinone)